MAKDPAFLFYPGDFVTGTMHLDFECKGAYMDLLILQFQKDHITLHMIKHVLGHKFEHIWPQIRDKFLEIDGKFWNVRLKKEKEKRVNYSESRKKNRNSKKDMSEHMSPHMENENKDENLDQDSIGGMGEKREAVVIYDIQEYLLSHQKDFEAVVMSSPKKDPELTKDVLEKFHLWNVQEGKYPKHPLKLIAGLKLWLLNEKNRNNGSNQQSSSSGNGKLGTSAARVDTAKKW